MKFSFGNVLCDTILKKGTPLFYIKYKGCVSLNACNALELFHHYFYQMLNKDK